jgi:hypothetical protein
MDESLLNESYADIVLFYTNRMGHVLSFQASNRLVRQEVFLLFMPKVSYLTYMRLRTSKLLEISTGYY